MDNFHITKYCAYALPTIASIAALYVLIFNPANASLTMAAISTISSATSLSIIILNTNNQHRDKDSRTSLEPNGSTGSTKISPEPNFRQFNHQRKQKHYKQTATKGKQ